MIGTADVIIFSFVAFYQFMAHHGCQMGIFTECFPEPGPAGIHSKVKNRRKSPCHAGRAGFIGRDFPCPAHKLRIPGK
jgi:hypothetical protein